MKKKLLLLAFAALATGTVFGAQIHNLKDHGLVAGINHVVAEAENHELLAPIILKYHDRIQNGHYDIPFNELQELYDEICKHIGDGKYQI